MRIRFRSSPRKGALVALIFLAGCNAEPIRNLGCEGPPAVEAGLRRAEALRDTCDRDEACWERALAEALSLRDRFPGELDAHRAYVLSRYRGIHGEFKASGKAVAEEYRGLLTRRPEDASLLYLNALLTENRLERRDLLRRSIARAEDFAWPRYALALELGWGSDPAAKAEAQAEGDRFVAACPDRLPEIQRLAGALGDAELFDRYRKRFADAFRPDRGRFNELATFWQQEFQFARPEQHAEIRAEVSGEVAAAAALEPTADRTWLRALQVGYRMTGDGAGAARVEELVLAALPCDPQAISIHQSRFRATHPKPERDDAAFDSWRQTQIATVDALLQDCPTNGLLRWWELNALSELADLPVERFVSAGMTLAAARDVHARPSNPAAVARRFLERRVGIEKVAALLEQDSEEMELEQARALQFVLDDEDRERARVEGLLRSAEHLALSSELALRQRQTAQSELTLAQAVAALDAVASGVRDEVQVQMLAAGRADSWRLAAELAEEKGDSAAALADYGQAIATAPPTDSLRNAAAAAFARLNGSGKKFAEWLDRADRAREAALGAKPILPPGAESRRAVVPDFRWTDLEGREWTRADLEGKAVLLNFWATWCGPCVAEMPFLTKLAKRFHDDPRILIVGVSVDESPGPVQPFVEKLGCDYPILLGGAAAWSQWRLAAIPKNMILDPSGGIVASDVAFSAEGDRWMETMAARLLEAAAGAAPGKS